MATNERSVELAGVNLAGQTHICAFLQHHGREAQGASLVCPDLARVWRWTSCGHTHS
jgi:hypothetical protein